MTNDMTRSFLVPGREGAGRVRPHRDRRLHARGPGPRLRGAGPARLDACPDKDLGTDVSLLAEQTTRTSDLSVWHVSTEISDKSTVDFLMGIARDGTSIAQVGFVPSGRVTMASGAFPALVRAGAGPAGRDAAAGEGLTLPQFLAELVQP